MILDRIENADLYYDVVPGLERFIQFFNDNDLETFPAMKLRLDGDDLFVNIQDIKLRAAKDCPMEGLYRYSSAPVRRRADGLARPVRLPTGERRV